MERNKKGRNINRLLQTSVIITWVTIKRLLYSKKTLGIIVLCLIPIILFSLWRFDMLPADEEEMYTYHWGNMPELYEWITDKNISVTINPDSMNFSISNLDGGTGTPGINISLSGYSNGTVDHLSISIYEFYNEYEPPVNIIDQYLPFLNGSLPGPIDLRFLVFKGTGSGEAYNWSTWKFIFDTSLFPELNFTELPDDDVNNGDIFDVKIPVRIGFYVRAFSDNVSTEQNWSDDYKELWLEFDINTGLTSGVVGEDIKSEAIDEDGYDVFFNVAYYLYFVLIIPLITILYSISVIRDDIENHTIVYLITRPISKTEILFYKYKGFIISTWIPISISISLTFFITASAEGSIFAHLDYLGTTFLLMTLAIFSYGALFLIFAIITSYPTVLSLIYVFFIENIISSQTNVINRFSITFHLQSILDGMVGNITNVGLYKTFQASDSIMVLVGISTVFMLIAIYIFNFKDFA